MELAPIASLLKRYSVPLVLLSFAIFFQLFVIPSTFPRSHYDVLGIKRYSSIEKVAEAYDKLSSKWDSGMEAPIVEEFIKIRYAFELLTNPVWKRDYDIFGVDDQLHVMEKVVGNSMGKNYSEVDLPLLSTSSSDEGLDVLRTEDFYSTIWNTSSWLIQVYSSGSYSCAQFSDKWRRIAHLLDGVANTGMVELGEIKLAAQLAEKKSTGKPFFRNGLPSLVAFPRGCSNLDCLVRYQGDLSVDAVTDWFATDILGLPRILYYSKETLGQNFIAKSGHHKVKVICFSRTGERAAPFLRQAAKDYWAYASFALVLWREEESSLWWNTFEVESAPAIVFLKDPGVKPVVFHGTLGSSKFANIMEQNKLQDLPQLRSVTSMELGCDARGHSRAGNDTATWYCVILAGRPSLELNRMRETIHSVQAILSSDEKSTATDKDDISVPVQAAAALKEKRLTFAWLDGEVQKKYCFFYLHSESSYETCGPRRDLTDVPQLFIVRYKRNFSNEKMNVERKRKTVWDMYQEDNEDLASQLVARYNGSNDILQIIQWVSQIVIDGDSRDLPFFTVQTPELIPEDGDPIWSKGAQRIVSTGKSIKPRISSFVSSLYGWIEDPRVGPIFLLGALLSFGSIWLQRDQSTQTTQSAQTTETNRISTEENPGPTKKTRRRPKGVSSGPSPPSITDVEPKNAQQWEFSDSDTDSE